MRKIKLFKFIWIAAGLFLLFVLVSCVVPPLFQKHKAEPQMVHPEDSAERVLCIEDNQDALLWRLRAIESAQKELVLATYKYRDDESGRDIVSALLQAAERGVQVRIVVDGISGSSDVRGSTGFQALASSPNVEVRFYNPVNLLTPWTLNYRMHDKYLIADNDLYILGGRNTKNLSLGNYPGAKDYDRDVLVYQPASQAKGSLAQVKAYFEQIWDRSKLYTPSTDKQDTQELYHHYEALRERLPEAFIIPNWEEQTLPTQGITLLSNPVEAGNKAPRLWFSLQNLMEQGSDILIQTPYMICNGHMYDDLGRLCDSDKQVQVVTNSVETGANLCGCVDYLNQKNKLLKTGLTIYEFQGDRSSHAKTVLIDKDISIVGSFNFDARSTYLDTELMLVIHSPELNAQLRQTLQNCMDQSRRNLPDGTQELGSRCENVKMTAGKQILYNVLRVVLFPVRHLL